MTLVDRLRAELAAGSMLILQRVPPGTSPTALASALGAVVVDDAFAERPALAVLDARGRPGADFSTWDAQRDAFGHARHPLIVMLDAAATRHLLRAAPHTTSWASGVQLPPSPWLATTRSDDERAHGDAALQRRLAQDPALRDRLAGKVVALDLQSGRVFERRADVSAIGVAEETLDEGLLHVARVEPRA